MFFAVSFNDNTLHHITREFNNDLKELVHFHKLFNNDLASRFKFYARAHAWHHASSSRTGWMTIKNSPSLSFTCEKEIRGRRGKWMTFTPPENVEGGC